MWLFLNDAFLSIVAPDTEKFKNKGDVLVVRARVEGDIQRVFPRAKVTSSKATDYQFRAVVLRDTVATAIAKFVLLELDYMNFKDSIPKKDKKRHDAYLRVWSVMNQEYGIPKYLPPLFDDDDNRWDWANDRWRDPPKKSKLERDAERGTNRRLSNKEIDEIVNGKKSKRA